MMNGMSYIQPETIEEAYLAFESNEKPIYYSGGTEIITFLRSGKIEIKTIIDLKSIVAYTKIEENEEFWMIGGGVTLNQIAEDMEIPLLSEVVSKIADHTVRNSLTIAGNISGRLPYREAVIPLLLLDAIVITSGAKGLVETPLINKFEKKIMLDRGEWILQIRIPKRKMDYISIRRTEGTEIDYPIIHSMAIKIENEIKIGYSGLAGYPVLFNPNEKEKLLGSIINDSRASSEYRRYLFETDYKKIMKVMK